MQRKVEPKKVRKIREADPSIPSADLAYELRMRLDTVSQIRNYITYQEYDPKPNPAAFALKRKYKVTYHTALRLVKDFNIVLQEVEESE